jgi:NAD(P)H-flavin reductase
MLSEQPAKVTTGSATPANALTPVPFRVLHSRRETRDTFTLTLEPGEQGGSFEFRPGQFNMLYAFGVGESAISISGDPGLRGKLVHTIREVGSVTSALRSLKRGDSLGVRGPFGSPWPIDDLKGMDVILIAGGIGLAPLRPALYRILARRADYGRINVLYGARTTADILYRNELEKWSSRLDVDVHATVDLADDSWHGNVGVVTTLIRSAAIDRLDTASLVCGPEIMMRFCIAELHKVGVDYERIFLSMERNMKCATGFCGHCQFGPSFVCKDGPVFPFARIQHWLDQREI